MVNNEIPDELWNDIPQIEPKTFQRKFRLSKENIKYLNSLEKNGYNQSTFVNLAIDLLKPKLSNQGFTEENLFNYLKSKK